MKHEKGAVLFLRKTKCKICILYHSFHTSPSLFHHTGLPRARNGELLLKVLALCQQSPKRMCDSKITDLKGGSIYRAQGAIGGLRAGQCDTVVVEIYVCDLGLNQGSFGDFKQSIEKFNQE